MESKKQSEPKSVKVIQTLLKNRGFDKHQIIDESKTDVIVAFGYAKHNHSELIKHNFKSKENEILKANGDVSFDEFLVKIKSINDIDVIAEVVK